MDARYFHNDSRAWRVPEDDKGNAPEGAFPFNLQIYVHTYVLAMRLAYGLKVSAGQRRALRLKDLTDAVLLLRAVPALLYPATGWSRHLCLRLSLINFRLQPLR